MSALCVGIAGYTSYVLILGAMAFVSDVTYVAAFRQLGVPIGVVVGAWGLSESVSSPRWVGTGLCTVGLLMIVVG